MKTRPKPSGQTLCWECAKAGGQCPWSRRFEPIEGWLASCVPLQCYSRTGISFIVHACPQYEHEDVHKYKRIDPDGMRALAIAVIWDAIKERQKLEHKAKAKGVSVGHMTAALDRVFRDDSLWMQIAGYDHDYIMGALKKREGKETLK